MNEANLSDRLQIIDERFIKDDKIEIKSKRKTQQ